MPQTAKIFKNGRSQAVRLPSEFRFDDNEKEVSIRRDPETGDVVLSKRNKSWDDFFKLRDALTQEERDAFVVPRSTEPPRVRVRFE